MKPKIRKIIILHGSYFCSAALETSEFRNIFWFFKIKAVTVYFLSGLNSCFFEMLMILELNSANISALITRVILCRFIEDRWGLLRVYHKRKCLSPWRWCVCCFVQMPAGSRPVGGPVVFIFMVLADQSLFTCALQDICWPSLGYYYKPVLTWPQCLVNFSAS